MAMSQQLVMKSDELRSIKKPNLARRVVAFIMDAALAVLAFFGFYLLFGIISTQVLHYNELMEEGYALRLQSHLYVEQEGVSGNTPIYLIEDQDIDYYKEKLKYYYCTFKTTEAADYNVEIDDGNGGKVLPINYYTEEWFNNKMVDVTTVEKAREASYDAVDDFVKYVSEINNKIKVAELVRIMPSFLLSYAAFFFIIPLCMKNGETLGKKTMSIGLVTKDGYSVKKRQIVARQLLNFFLATLVGFYFSIGVWSFFFLGFGVVIYYLVCLVNKDNRSLADFLAYTMMINTKLSVWFKDPEEENKKTQIVEENLSKYNKVKEENKNIIQVGSTIVNEDIKKELEEEQKEKSKPQK